jgi:hypothetical protein
MITYVVRWRDRFGAVVNLYKEGYKDNSSFCSKAGSADTLTPTLRAFIMTTQAPYDGKVVIGIGL